jgi:phage gp46-like protein
MDIRLAVRDDNQIDIAFTETDLETDEGLETATLISLYSDGRATPEEVDELETSLRGYWGDMVPDVSGDKHGSLLWTTHRDKQTNANRLDIQEKTASCLDWMQEDGIADSVIVKTSIIGKGDVQSDVEIVKPDEKGPTTISNVWNGQGMVR